MDRIRNKSKVSARGRSAFSRKNQKLKVRKLIVMFLFLLVVCFLSLVALWWFRGWNGKDPWNVVIVSESEIWVLSVRPLERRLVEILIPGTTVIRPWGKGQVLARALWQISQLDHDPTVISTVGTDLLQIPIDESIYLDNWIRSQSTRIRRPSIFQIPEFIRLVWYKSSLRDTEVLRIELEELPAVRRVVDPSGMELFEVDRELLSPLTSRWFEVLGFRESNLSISVVSSRYLPGFGAHIAKQLEHSGLRVVSVANGEQQKGIYVSSKKLVKDPIVQKLGKWFLSPIIVSNFEERADILVVQ